MSDADGTADRGRATRARRRSRPDAAPPSAPRPEPAMSTASAARFGARSRRRDERHGAGADHRSLRTRGLDPVHRTNRLRNDARQPDARARRGGGIHAHHRQRPFGRRRRRARLAERALPAGDRGTRSRRRPRRTAPEPIAPSAAAPAHHRVPARRPRLLALGLPPELTPSTAVKGDLRTALCQRLAQLPPPPMLPRTSGVVIAIVGIGTAPIALGPTTRRRARHRSRARVARDARGDERRLAPRGGGGVPPQLPAARRADDRRVQHRLRPRAARVGAPHPRPARADDHVGRRRRVGASPKTSGTASRCSAAWTSSR